MFDMRDHSGNFGGGNGGKLNVYTQLTEPTKKEGIWIQTSTPRRKIINDIGLWFANAWNDENLKKFATIPWSINSSTAVSIGKYVYVTSGASQAYDLFRYDTENDTWSQMPTSPYYCAYGCAVVIGQKIYIYGRGASDYNTHLCFDTETNTWTKLANIPYSFTGSSAIAIDKIVYLFGGAQGTKNAYSYNTETNTWTQLTNIPYAFSEGAVGAVGGKIYLIGGTGSPAITTVYAYDIATNTWQSRASMPQNSRNHTVVAVGTNIYLMGGTGTTAITNILIYDTIANTWKTGDTLPYQVYYHASVYCENGIYIMGGTGPSPITHYTDVRKFNFTSKVYEEGTVVLYRTSEVSGNYKAELITPAKSMFTGVNIRLLVPFDNVYMYVNSTLKESMPTYYGDGTKWVKFKGA